MPTLYDNFNRVKDFINENNSSYVSKAELASASYASISYLYNNGLKFYPDSIEIDKDIDFEQDAFFHVGTTYISDLYINGNQINTVFPTYAYVSENFITQNTLDNASYVTSSDLPIINENIIPKETGTYTLGDASHRYIDTYSYNYRFGYITYLASDNDYDIHLAVNGRNKVQWNLYQYIFVDDNYRAQSSLGVNGRPWGNTYTTNIYTPNIFDPANSNNSIKFQNGSIRLAYNDVGFYLDNSGLRPGTNGNKLLGKANYKWGSTYTSNLYADTAYLHDTSYTSSIIPNTTATYTLGDESHLYSATYSARLKVGNNSQIYNDGGGITFSINSNNEIRIGSSGIYPKTSGGFSLGSSSNKWKNAYISNLYIDSSTYLPKNTYWYDGSSYHWLGTLFN